MIIPQCPGILYNIIDFETKRLKIKDRPRSTYTVVCVWPFSPQINNNNTSTLGADSENAYTHAFHDNFHSFRGHEEKTLSHAIH